MKITIITQHYSKMRYPTVGDWTGDKIYVAETDDDRYNFMIAIHEFVEQFLCQYDGVGEEEVTAFDLKHLNTDEPGALVSAPYHIQHMDAEKVERLMADILGVDWTEYDNYVSTIFFKGLNQCSTCNNMSPKVKKREMKKGKVKPPAKGARKSK